jgi:hypothetical protein
VILPPGLRKLALAVHLSVSVGWIGAVVAYIALGISATTSEDAQTLLGTWIALETVGWYAIVPLAGASLLTGIVMALGTKWGLFRHYWVLFSFVLTVFAAIVLVLHMPDVSARVDLALEASGRPKGMGEHVSAQLKGGDLLHPVLGLVVLLVIQTLNVYKPRGMTRLGQRKGREQDS